MDAADDGCETVRRIGCTGSAIDRLGPAVAESGPDSTTANCVPPSIN